MSCFSFVKFLVRSPTLFLVISPALVLIFNEYLIYYLVIGQCEWPAQNRTNVMLIADTHLLGIRNGHWFDKLRREWQMRRSFQTAVRQLKPRAVFFLGDLFDEGEWSSDSEFHTYLENFESMFRADNVARYTVVGNHDVGFHYAIVPHRLERFSTAFQTPKSVDATVIDGNVFVMINSMAMERDGCRLCGEAEREVERLSTCLANGTNCAKQLPSTVPRPILMQHFPLYRRSDMECEKAPDLPPDDIITEKFRENWECLSENSTNFLIQKLRPRAAFGGHTHYGCKKWWKNPFGFWEYTIPSFSWRNNRHPVAMLLSVSPEQLSVARCFMPHEHTVVVIYGMFLFLWASGFVLTFVLACTNFGKRKRVNKFALVPDKVS